MTSPLGWPDPTKLGIPSQADRSGWHWVMDHLGGEEAAYWDAAGQEWHFALDERRYPASATIAVAYLGRCLTPSEQAEAGRAAGMVVVPEGDLWSLKIGARTVLEHLRHTMHALQAQAERVGSLMPPASPPDDSFAATAGSVPGKEGEMACTTQENDDAR